MYPCQVKSTSQLRIALDGTPPLSRRSAGTCRLSRGDVLCEAVGYMKA